MGDSTGGASFLGEKWGKKVDFLNISPFMNDSPEMKEPKKPKTITKEQAAKSASLAADKKKKEAIAAYGTGDTILTDQSGGGKKLLG